MTTGLTDRYQKFWFEGFQYQFDDTEQQLRIELKYSLDQQINFVEKLEIPLSAERWAKVDLKALDRAMEALLIIGGVSYFKTYLPKEMAGLKLTSDQAEFWQKVYQRGLGEFFYANQIDFRGLINFPATEKTSASFESTPLSERCLVPIGGGKDSVVTAELLKKSDLEMELFSLRDAEPIRATAEIIGKPRLLVSRELDAQLFKLNEEGALNGHVPITAYISCLLVVCAIVYDYKYIVFSLEKSANYGQLMFHGMDINHQYSKSEEFERDWSEYLKNYISTEIEYFSLLRAWNELRIAQIFAGLSNFFDYAPRFTSCNANFKIIKEKSKTLWCGNCPKCAFVFLILAPFVEKEKLVAIFGQNLLERKDLLELYEEILGVRNFKPFECVGTAEESQVALWMISQKNDYKDDFLVKHFVEKIMPGLKVKDWASEEKKVLATMEQNFIPEKFWQLIKQA